MLRSIYAFNRMAAADIKLKNSNTYSNEKKTGSHVKKSLK